MNKTLNYLIKIRSAGSNNRNLENKQIVWNFLWETEMPKLNFLADKQIQIEILTQTVGIGNFKAGKQLKIEKFKGWSHRTLKIAYNNIFKISNIFQFKDICWIITYAVLCMFRASAVRVPYHIKKILREF